jgi:hypothetical protein
MKIEPAAGSESHKPHPFNNYKSTTVPERFEASPPRAHPHKSTTVPERYYHFNDAFKGTVFFRLQPNGVWAATVALVAKGDQFNRAVGRVVARRKWFNKPEQRIYFWNLNIGTPEYADAEQAYITAEARLRGKH